MRNVETRRTALTLTPRRKGLHKYYTLVPVMQCNLVRRPYQTHRLRFVAHVAIGYGDISTQPR